MQRQFFQELLVADPFYQVKPPRTAFSFADELPEQLRVTQLLECRKPYMFFLILLRDP